MSKPPFRDPKYSGWPGPEPVQADLEDAIEAAPQAEPASSRTPKKKKPVEQPVEDAAE